MRPARTLAANASPPVILIEGGGAGPVINLQRCMLGIVIQSTRAILDPPFGACEVTGLLILAAQTSQIS